MLKRRLFYENIEIFIKPCINSSNYVTFFGVMFSSNIVSYMTKTKHSEFENVKFSIKNSEMNFDNFVVNGKVWEKDGLLSELSELGYSTLYQN